MKKSTIRKVARKGLYKAGRTHQEIFDELKTRNKEVNKKIATELAKLPSLSKINRYKTLRLIYLIALSLVIILKGLGVGVLLSGQFGGPTLILFILLAVILPGLGIFGVLTHRVELLKGVAMLFILGIVRSINEIDVTSVENLIWIIPVLTVIILGYWLPLKMRVPFKTRLTSKVVEGKEVKEFTVHFEEEKSMENDELLDSAI